MKEIIENVTKMIRANVNLGKIVFNVLRINYPQKTTNCTGMTCFHCCCGGFFWSSTVVNISV